MKSFILCGGFGTRLNLSVPKILAKVKNKTILEIQVDFLKKYSKDITAPVLPRIGQSDFQPGCAKTIRRTAYATGRHKNKQDACQTVRRSCIVPP